MTERLFILARHAESTANTGHLLSSNPSQPIGLTPNGREQARGLGQQLANLEIDLAVATSFLRTQETAELALQNRRVPLLLEPDLDEIHAGIFDGRDIDAYWKWREQHPRSKRFPGGESLNEAMNRYANALQRLLERREKTTLIVAHELAIRYVTEAAAGLTLGQTEHGVPNAIPYLFDEDALIRAAKRLKAVAAATPLEVRTAA